MVLQAIGMLAFFMYALWAVGTCYCRAMRHGRARKPPQTLPPGFEPLAVCKTLASKLSKPWAAFGAVVVHGRAPVLGSSKCLPPTARARNASTPVARGTNYSPPALCACIDTDSAYHAVDERSATGRNIRMHGPRLPRRRQPRDAAPIQSSERRARLRRKAARTAVHGTLRPRTQHRRQARGRGREESWHGRHAVDRRCG